MTTFCKPIAQLGLHIFCLMLTSIPCSNLYIYEIHEKGQARKLACYFSSILHYLDSQGFALWLPPAALPLDPSCCPPHPILGSRSRARHTPNLRLHVQFLKILQKTLAYSAFVMADLCDGGLPPAVHQGT